MTPKQRLDYFSAMALQGLLASSDYDWAVDEDVEGHDDDNSFSENTAATAVDMAKAIIKRLDKENL